MKSITCIKGTIFFICVVVFISICSAVCYAMLPEDADEQVSVMQLDPQAAEYVPGEILVKFKEGVDPKSVLDQAELPSDNVERIYSTQPAVSKFKKDYKLDENPSGGWYSFMGKNYKDASDISDEAAFKEAYKAMPDSEKALYRTYKVVLPEGLSTEEAIDKLSGSDDVEYAEPNGMVSAQMVPNDEAYYDDKLWGIKRIRSDAAWDLSQGEGIVIAVIDTGVDYVHLDLSSNIYKDANGKVIGYNFVKGNSDPMDDNGHGTHCAGTIAAVGNNWKGVIGVAPKSKIMPIKGLNENGAGDINTLAKCVKYAVDNGAQVISSSWGGAFSSQALVDAFHYADSKGCVCIAAAGNTNVSTSTVTPANIDTVIAVAAINQDNQKAYFSNWGVKADVAAPGVSIYSTFLENWYLKFTGTSMACPHVAGVVGLILSLHRNYTPAQIKLLLRNTSVVMPSLQGSYRSGFGIVDARAALDTKICDIKQPISCVGLYNPLKSVFNIKKSYSGSGVDSAFLYGTAKSGWTPITGDWDGDGITTVGLYDPKTSIFYLRNSLTPGGANIKFKFGSAKLGWIPITGDWDGNGITTVGLYDPKTSTFHLRNSNKAGSDDIKFKFGTAKSGWIPIAGDWDGDGITTVGLYNPKTSTFHLRNLLAPGSANIKFKFGSAKSGWTPIAGDWNGDGITTIGLYEPTTSTFYLRNSHTPGSADIKFKFGPAKSGWMPIVGYWDR